MSYKTNYDQSESNGGAEQITKEPSITPKREKDPKRVAAGKKLAENNKLMREEHARYKASEARRVVEASPETIKYETETSDGLLSQLSLTNVISLVGIGLTVYTIFFKKSGDTNGKPTNTGDSTRPSKHATWQEPVHTTMNEPKPKPKTKPRPKFGM